MYRLVMDHAQPGGQRGLVWGRLHLNPRRTTEHDDDGEADVKGKSKEVPEKRSDNPRNIIIPPSLDDEDLPSGLKRFLIQGFMILLTCHMLDTASIEAG
jgi:hypothetical protein